MLDSLYTVVYRDGSGAIKLPCCTTLHKFTILESIQHAPPASCLSRSLTLMQYLTASGCWGQCRPLSNATHTPWLSTLFRLNHWALVLANAKYFETSANTCLDSVSECAPPSKDVRLSIMSKSKGSVLMSWHGKPWKPLVVSWTLVKFGLISHWL